MRMKIISLLMVVFGAYHLFIYFDPNQAVVILIFVLGAILYVYTNAT